MTYLQGGHPNIEVKTHSGIVPIERELLRQPTVEVARSLIGAILHRRIGDSDTFSARIIETEAYTWDDPACHAFKGKSKRCQVMFGDAGFAYVYFIYGMYHCLNIVTEPEGTAGAVLIRAIDSDGGSGPGKLCREWQINKEHNGLDLLDPESEIFLSAGKKIDFREIEVSTRIGISRARERPWRFFLGKHPGVSKPRRKKSANDDLKQENKPEIGIFKK